MKERSLYIPGDAIGISQEQEQEAELMRAAGGKGQWQHFTPEFVGTKTQEVDQKRVFREIKQQQILFQEARVSQPEGKVKIETDLPVSIFFVGDIHFGSIYSDHERFRKEMEEIANTPNAYVVFMSNLIDNAIPSQYPANMLVNAIPPDKQVVVMRQIVQGLDEKGRVLGAVVSDCHEGWTWRHTGQDINALIYGFEDRKFPVLENGGRLNITVGKRKYVIGLYHKIGPFRSNFNRLHGLQQMNRLQQNMECDVVVGAHYHVAAVETTYEGQGKEHRRPIVYIQSGSYKGIDKIHDQWSQTRYGRTGEPSAQSVELWPDKRRMEAFLEFDTGILAHECFFLKEMIKRE